MASNSIPISSVVLNNFEQIINNPTFETKPSSLFPAYLLFASIVGSVAGTICYVHYTLKKVTLGAVALILIPTIVLGYLYVYKKAQRLAELKKPLSMRIERAFKPVFHALQTETYYKQQKFLYVYNRPLIGGICPKQKEFSKKLKDYNEFYNQHPIDSAIFTSMANYRKLLPLAEKFLINFAQNSMSDIKEETLKRNLIELREKCALFIYGQSYQDDGRYPLTYVAIINTRNVLPIIGCWAPVELPPDIKEAEHAGKPPQS
jgi:hypothetical protein